MSSSQRSGLASDIDNEQLAAQVVRHLLFKQHSQPGVPVKREELVALLQQQYPNHKGLLAAVLPLAQRKCRDILGFELLDVSGTTPSQASPSQPLSSGKLFVLRSRLSPGVLREYVLTDEAAEDVGLRLTVCALVHGAGGSVPEATFWGLLGRMGVKKSSVSHPAFGNVSERFQHLVKEKFVALKRGVADDGSEAVCVELGPRALSEIGANALKRYFEDVCDGKEVT